MLLPQSIIVIARDRTERESITNGLSASRVGNKVIAFETAEATVRYLTQLPAGPDAADAVEPGLMLLDIDLGGELSGFDLLKWVRSHPRFRRLPVVMLSRSDLSADIDRAYDLGVNSYLLKPFEADALKQLLKSINGYWVVMVEKPRL